MRFSISRPTMRRCQPFRPIFPKRASALPRAALLRAALPPAAGADAGGRGAAPWCHDQRTARSGPHPRRGHLPAAVRAAHPAARRGARTLEQQPALQRPDPARRRGPGRRHPAADQLTRRLGPGHARDPRLHALDPERRRHREPGDGIQRRAVPAEFRHARQALRPGALEGAAAPGFGRHRRDRHGHRDPGRRPAPHARHRPRPDRGGHRPGRRADRTGLAPGPLVQRARSARLRLRRRDRRDRRRRLPADRRPIGLAAGR
jgi:hypothetical protein